MDAVIKTGAVVIEGHIQGLSNTRALGESGIPVYVVDKTDCIARYSRYCTKFFRSPAYNSDEMADFLLRLAEEEGIRNWLLLPSNDHAVHTLARHRDRLAQYYSFATPGWEVYRNIYDKAALLSLAVEAGVPVPRSIMAVKEGFPDKPGMDYPLLVKGRRGLDFYRRTGRKAYYIRDAAAYSKVCERLSRDGLAGECLIQEVIPFEEDNHTISFAALSEEGSIKAWWTGAKLREHPLRFGTATFCESVRIEELVTVSGKLLKVLNYTGVCEIEYLKDERDGQYKLIEINARTWLWVGLARAAGIDFAGIAWRHACGKPLSAPTGYDTGVRWVNRFTDIAWSLSAIVRGRLGLLTWLRSYRGRVVDAIALRGDNRPVAAYVRLLLRFFRQR